MSGELFSTLPASAREALLRAARGKTVSLPEGNDERIRAAALLLKDVCGVRAVLGDAQEAARAAKETLAAMQSCANERGKTLTDAQEALAFDPFFAAGAALRRGEVDAVVGGVVASTAHVIRAALGTVGLRREVKTITSGFLLALAQPTAGGESVVIFADGAVVPQPTSAQLIDIAALAASAYSRWTGGAPRVAFLSFSTSGSADHPDVRKVRDAWSGFVQAYPAIPADGETQFDTATVPAIALRKHPGGVLAGRANVFVFPDLDAGNIGYKMAQRLAGAEAWGPVLFGSAKPFSDLSRGASERDVVHGVLLALANG